MSILNLQVVESTCVIVLYMNAIVYLSVIFIELAL